MPMATAFARKRSLKNRTSGDFALYFALIFENNCQRQVRDRLRPPPPIPGLAEVSRRRAYAADLAGFALAILSPREAASRKPVIFAALSLH